MERGGWFWEGNPEGFKEEDVNVDLKRGEHHAGERGKGSRRRQRGSWRRASCESSTKDRRKSLVGDC